MNWKDILKIGEYVKDMGNFYELESSPPIKIDKEKIFMAIEEYKKVVLNRTNAGVSSPEDVTIEGINSNSSLFSDFIVWARENRIGDA
jgi:hypothetical protein